jgi:aspartate aminotransferase
VLAALKGSQQCVTDMRDEFNIRRDYMYERLAAIPNMTAVKPLVAFYMLANVAKLGLSSTNFADRLLSKAEVAVVPGIAFGDDHAVRLSYATDLETIKTGLDRIEQFCRTI